MMTISGMKDKYILTFNCLNSEYRLIQRCNERPEKGLFLQQLKTNYLDEKYWEDVDYFAKYFEIPSGKQNIFNAILNTLVCEIHKKVSGPVEDDKEIEF